MNADKILYDIDYPVQLIPVNAKEIVEVMLQAKTLGYTTEDRMALEHRCTSGFFNAVKNAIREQREADSYTARSTENARANRILTIRNSDGKAQARRF